jgi:hypothetical protein
MDEYLTSQVCPTGANAAQKIFEREEFLLSTHQPTSMPYSTAEILERYGTGTRWLPRIWKCIFEYMATLNNENAKYISTANTDAVRKSKCRQLGGKTDLES